MALMDDNKSKIVASGIVAHYVKLLTPERLEDILLQTQVVHGLWTLAFKCTDDILKQPGCIDGMTISQYHKISLLGRVALKDVS